MQPESAVAIRSNPDFIQLEQKRNAFSWIMAAIMLAVYGCFIALVAFAPGLMATPIGESVLTWGFPAGIGVILVAIALTGIYVWRANTEFDRLVRNVRDRAQ